LHLGILNSIDFISATEWKDEAARLLSEVAMFRLALNHETAPSSIKSK
jgi:hypothetical protein